jgi:ATP-dependent RNA helicase DDX3X
MSAPGRTFYRRPDHPESPSPFDGDDNQQQQNASITGSDEHRQNPSFAGGGRQQRGASFADDDRPQRDDELPIRVTKYDEQVFGPEIFDKLQSIETPRCQAPRDFASKVRDIDDLFGEDERSADNYATTIADDDVITVEGVSGELITIDSWADAQLPEALMKNIARAKYIKPRQIQKTAIPLIMDRYDVIGQAETGSGKTAAYLIPIIAECMDAKENGTFKSDTGYPYCVILAPTRELVRQCFDQARKFAHDTDVTVANAYGEKPTRKNVQEINEGCDILVISPGRFKHLSDEGCIGFNKMRFLVFDEGDHLLTPVFLNDIRPILQLPSFPKGNVRQTLFFSATFDDEMINSAKEFMRDEGFRALVSNRKIAVNKKCAQVFCAPEHSTKFSILVDFMQKELEKGLILVFVIKIFFGCFS